MPKHQIKLILVHNLQAAGIEYVKKIGKHQLQKIPLNKIMSFKMSGIDWTIYSFFLVSDMAQQCWMLPALTIFLNPKEHEKKTCV